MFLVHLYQCFVGWFCFPECSSQNLEVHFNIEWRLLQTCFTATKVQFQTTKINHCAVQTFPLTLQHVHSNLKLYFTIYEGINTAGFIVMIRFHEVIELLVFVCRTVKAKMYTPIASTSKWLTCLSVGDPHQWFSVHPVTSDSVVFLTCEHDVEKKKKAAGVSLNTNRDSRKK